jgi:hypothetical protein
VRVVHQDHTRRRPPDYKNIGNVVMYAEEDCLYMQTLGALVHSSLSTLLLLDAYS